MLNRLIDTIQDETAREILKDQSIVDLLFRRRFRLTQSHLDRLLLALGETEWIRDLSMAFGEGVLEVKGRTNIRMLPAVPFQLSLSVAGILTTEDGPVVTLRPESVDPLPLTPFIRFIIGHIPFLTYGEGLIHCHLRRVPGLDRILLQRVGRRRLADMLILRELNLHRDELTGRVGILL